MVIFMKEKTESTPHVVPVHPHYERLNNVLRAALRQAQNGKGADRHANGLPFEKQRMQAISHLLGSERGMAYQVCKKVVEGLDLPTHEMRVKELLGAINYIAGIVIYLQDTNGEAVEMEAPETDLPSWWIRESDGVEHRIVREMGQLKAVARYRPANSPDHITGLSACVPVGSAPVTEVRSDGTICQVTAESHARKAAVAQVRREVVRVGFGPHPSKGEEK